MDILNKLTRQGLVLAALIGAFAISNVQAATFSPPAPTPTSTGTMDVTVTVGDLVWIQDLDPIALTHTLGVNSVGMDDFCIFSTTASYDITITSQTATASPTFNATGQAVPANVVDFTVRFDNDIDASDGTGVTEGVQIPGGFVNSNTAVPPDCSVNNAALEVTFPFAGLQGLDLAPADTYEDELTLLVEPI